MKISHSQFYIYIERERELHFIAVLTLSCKVVESNVTVDLGPLSHTRLKAWDHCILRSLIGLSGGDCSNSLYIRRRRFAKLSWMKSLHESYIK